MTIRGARRAQATLVALGTAALVVACGALLAGSPFAAAAGIADAFCWLWLAGRAGAGLEQARARMGRLGLPAAGGSS